MVYIFCLKLQLVFHNIKSTNGICISLKRPPSSSFLICETGLAVTALQCCWEHPAEVEVPYADMALRWAGGSPVFSAQPFLQFSQSRGLRMFETFLEMYIYCDYFI